MTSAVERIEMPRCILLHDHGHDEGHCVYEDSDRCYLCRRREVDANVTLDGAVRGICDTCWQRGQDEILIPLDYTTDEGDDE